MIIVPLLPSFGSTVGYVERGRELSRLEEMPCAKTALSEIGVGNCRATPDLRDPL
jgi:hypothetical protein